MSLIYSFTPFSNALIVSCPELVSAISCMSLSVCVQMTALSVGYIQTYRDSVDSLGESVDMSIKVREQIAWPDMNGRMSSEY